ncbi:hypothetical protein KC19_1G139200 [Ceratodon purpureus]|uniref:Uncharacterized protein n=1 Tax=Ceratodon purpureus TaxID=3225 RepID=A0A8T0J602_CERPU|nr:hypothetical protein KC19_1G139200 [Ceratodon purpureus]
MVGSMYEQCFLFPGVCEVWDMVDIRSGCFRAVLDVKLAGVSWCWSLFLGVFEILGMNLIVWMGGCGGGIWWGRGFTESVWGQRSGYYHMISLHDSYGYIVGHKSCGA